MAKISFTKDQQKVIDLRNRNILVSAAAGSGKTAVLVERIITMISDTDKQVDIDRLLIVTFTKAAAGEMKERIGAAIEKKVLEDPDNVHLQKQMTLIHNAQITTIDSFCLNVVRNYFHLIDLDPSFRIGDNAELTLIKADVMAEILEEQYEIGREEFLEFIECYSNAKSDAPVEEFVEKIYQFSMSYPWPKDWLHSLKSSFEATSLEELNQTNWMKELLAYMKAVITDAMAITEAAIKICKEADGPEQYIEALTSDGEMLDRFVGCDTYEAYEEVIHSIEFKRLSAKKNDAVSEEKKEAVKALRGKVKDTITSLKKDYFFQETSEMLCDMQLVKRPMLQLIDLVLLFLERFEKKKEEKNLLDFSDLEHNALKILVEKTGDGELPSKTAMELSEQFVEIMIDEYQDSNLVQETILNSISTERIGKPNVFMVGDVKQSIYKFRLARPELFMDKYETYTKEDSLYQKIDLHKNFRSRSLVLESINRIFEQIMKKTLGGIEYDKDAALYPGADFPESVGTETEIILVETVEKEADENSEAIDSMEDEEKEYTTRELEARAIAKRIKEMVNDNEGMFVTKKDGTLTKATYGDIVILLRTMSGWAEVFTDVLMNEGIPTFSDTQSGYFKTTEIRTMLSYLKVLDNPLQDIPFTAVLYSPFVGLTSEELALLRIGTKELKDSRELPLYELAIDYEERGENSGLKLKLTKFFEDFSYLRAKVAYLPIHELILEIFKRTGYDLYVAAMPAGDKRRSNLSMLVKKAIAFEKTSYHGLFQFIRYIEKLIRYNIDYGESMTAGENDNAVRIMSIHKSKGLEFPIVFVGGMAKPFNTSDTRAKIVLHADYGIGPECIDIKRRTKVPTLLKKVIQKQGVLENIGEELRILYVALTRAKEKLIMIGTTTDVDKLQNDWKSETIGCEQGMKYSTIASAKNYFDFVGPAIILLDTFQLQIMNKDSLTMEEKEKQQKQSTLKELLLHFDENFESKQEIREQLVKRLRYEYPFIKEATLPIKTTVSELKKLSMNEEIESEYLYPSKQEDSTSDNRTFPKFLKEEQVVKATAKGTLYHKILELMTFLDMHTKEDVEGFTQKLVKEEVIEKELLESVELSGFVHFLKQPIAERIRKAEKLGTFYKEQQFVLGIPSIELNKEYGGSEIVLIQGIIDAYFEEDGAYVLIDYKTDRVTQEEELVTRYKKQLEYYERALTQITGKPVKEKIIYSFTLQKEIKLP